MDKNGQLLDQHAQYSEGPQPGSLAWAGLKHLLFLDRSLCNVAGVILMQALLFADRKRLEAFAGLSAALNCGLDASAREDLLLRASEAIHRANNMEEDRFVAVSAVNVHGGNSPLPRGHGGLIYRNSGVTFAVSSMRRC